MSKIEWYDKFLYEVMVMLLIIMIIYVLHLQFKICYVHALIAKKNVLKCGSVYKMKAA